MPHQVRRDIGGEERRIDGRRGIEEERHRIDGRTEAKKDAETKRGRVRLTPVLSS